MKLNEMIEELQRQSAQINTALEALRGLHKFDELPDWVASSKMIAAKPAVIDAAPFLTTPRRRGRPSKAVALARALGAGAPKRRGRPPGSKNKPKAA